MSRRLSFDCTTGDQFHAGPSATTPRHITSHFPAFSLDDPLDNNSSSNVMPSDVDHTTRDQYWSPGQTLPPFSPQPTVRSDADFAGEQSFFVLQSMIQGMHKDIQSNFQSINDQITRLEVRIDTIERKESPPSVSETPASSTGDSSTDSSSTKSRKRRSPSELQVSVINVCIHHS